MTSKSRELFEAAGLAVEPMGSFAGTYRLAAAFGSAGAGRTSGIAASGRRYELATNS